MSRSDVEWIIGRPPGVYYNGDVVMTGEEAIVGSFECSDLMRPPPGADGWRDDHAQIFVEYENGRVVGAGFQGLEPKTQTFMQRALRWAGLDGLF